MLAEEPWQEQAVLLGLRACLGLNDRAGALHLYRRLTNTLHEELDTTPRDELRAFYQALTAADRPG